MHERHDQVVGAQLFITLGGFAALRAHGIHRASIGRHGAPSVPGGRRGLKRCLPDSRTFFERGTLVAQQPRLTAHAGYPNGDAPGYGRRSEPELRR